MFASRSGGTAMASETVFSGPGAIVVVLARSGVEPVGSGAEPPLTAAAGWVSASDDPGPAAGGFQSPSAGDATYHRECDATMRPVGLGQVPPVDDDRACRMV